MPKIGELTLDLKTNLAQFQTDMTRAAKSVEQTAERINKLTTGIGAGFAALGGGALFGKILSEAANSEVAMKKVEAVIRSTGGAAGVTATQVSKLSDEISKLTGIDDDAVTEAQALMLTFTNISKEVFPDAIRATVDMSKALGIDLKTAAMQVGKALNDPERGMKALRKEGIAFSAAQEDMIKGFVKTNRVIDAQRVEIAELNKEFGGMGAAMRDSMKGAMDTLNESMNDLYKSMAGPESLRTGLEALIKLIDTLTAMMPNLTGAFDPVVNATGVATEAIMNFIEPVMNAFIGLSKSMVDMGAAFAVLGDMDVMELFGERAKAVMDGFAQSVTENFSENHFGAARQNVKNFFQDVQNDIASMGVNSKRASNKKQPTVDASELLGLPTKESLHKKKKEIEEAIKEIDEAMAAIRDEREKGAAEMLKKGKEWEAEEQNIRNQKQVDLKKDRDLAKGYTDQLERQIELIKMRNSGNADGLIQLEAEQQISGLTNVIGEERAELLQKLIKLKKEEKELEAISEMSSRVEQLRQQAEAIERKVAGQEEYNEELKLQREIQDKISADNPKRQELSNQVAQYSERVRQANQALEEHKRVIDKILSSSDSYAQKLKKLTEARDADKINIKEYNSALEKLKDQQEKAKSSFQGFAEKVTSGFEDAIFKGKKLTDVFKDLGKELLKLVAKKFLFEPIQQGITGMLAKVFPTGQFGLQPGGGGFQFGGFNLGGLFGGKKAPGAPGLPGINPPPGTPGAPGTLGMPPTAPAFNPAGGGLGTPGTSSFQNMGAFGPLIHTGDGGPAWKVYVVNQCPCPTGPGPLMATGNPLLNTIPGPPMQGLPPGGGYIPPTAGGSASTKSTQESTSGQFKFDPGALFGGLLGGLLGGMGAGAPAGGGGGLVRPRQHPLEGMTGRTIGGYSLAGRAEADAAMRYDSERQMQNIRGMDVHPDLKTGWLLNARGQWDNAIKTNARSNNANGYYRPGPGEGASYQSGWGSASNGMGLMGMMANLASAGGGESTQAAGPGAGWNWNPVGNPSLPGGAAYKNAGGAVWNRPITPVQPWNPSTGYGSGTRGFANGGRPPVGQVSKVGERGPELFIPDTAGTVIPFEKVKQGSAGGGKPNISLVNNTGVAMEQPDVQMAANGDPILVLNKMVAAGQSSYQARKQLKRNTNVVERPNRRS